MQIRKNYHPKHFTEHRLAEINRDIDAHIAAARQYPGFLAFLFEQLNEVGSKLDGDAWVYCDPPQAS